LMYLFLFDLWKVCNEKCMRCIFLFSLTMIEVRDNLCAVGFVAQAVRA
jgi:hypothetical protein